MGGTPANEAIATAKAPANAGDRCDKPFNDDRSSDSVRARITLTTVKAARTVKR